MRHYRVDKMTGITVTNKPLEGTEQYSAFDIAVYGQKHFGMYSGEEMTVTLRGTRAMVGVVLDRFGQDVILVPDGPEHFTVSIPLVLSPQFFGWLFALEPRSWRRRRPLTNTGKGSAWSRPNIAKINRRFRNREEVVL